MDKIEFPPRKDIIKATNDAARARSRAVKAATQLIRDEYSREHGVDLREAEPEALLLASYETACEATMALAVDKTVNISEVIKTAVVKFGTPEQRENAALREEVLMMLQAENPGIDFSQHLQLIDELVEDLRMRKYEVGVER